MNIMKIFRGHSKENKLRDNSSGLPFFSIYSIFASVKPLHLVVETTGKGILNNCIPKIQLFS